MKKIFSIIMVMIMVLSMTATGFAAENTGSITITNATIGDTYNLYKIFDATYNPSNAAAVAYSIKNDNQFFTYLFGADGKEDNPYFTYNAKTGGVERKKNTENKAIIDYLAGMIRDTSSGFNPDKKVPAAAETVVFDDIPYGYYLIDKAGVTDAAVTVTSNTPEVEVVDKNQKPGGGDSFKKLVWDEETEEWVQSSSANIGDIVDFKVEFDATNYDGEDQIKYYTVNDTKGDALWMEFESVEVTVQVPDGKDGEGNIKYDDVTNDKVLNKGYYHCANPDPDFKTGEWNLLGEGWTTDEKNAEKTTPGTYKDAAQWYLIHRGYDDFDIVIPWMDNHTFTGTDYGMSLTFDKGTGSQYHSLYPSPARVVLKYNATVEPTAEIGAGKGNLWNKATLSWTGADTDGPDNPSETDIDVYALGMSKVDADNGNRLAGAVFELYRDEAGTNPVYIIPTDYEGVYILDDVDTQVTGRERVTAREKYYKNLEAYLGAGYTKDTKKNVMTTPANGKIVVLGLESGTYYLKETVAPGGYNKLDKAEVVTVGDTNNSFFVIVDPTTGQVFDKQTADENNLQKVTYTATSVVVENSTGVVLPSTGGEGTMMLITIGSIVALAFAVLLITHKKMTVYHD